MALVDLSGRARGLRWQASSWALRRASRRYARLLVQAGQAKAVLGQFQAPPRSLGLGFAVYTHRAPHEHSELLVVEPGHGDRQPPVADPRDHMIPPKRPDLFSAKTDGQAHRNVGAHQRAWAHAGICGAATRVAVQAVGQPVLGRLVDGHRLRLAYARLDVGVQLPELVPYLGLDLAVHLAAGSPAVRAVSERDAAPSCPCSSRSRQGVLWS